jgi:hypothetical protein
MDDKMENNNKKMDEPEITEREKKKYPVTPRRKVLPNLVMTPDRILRSSATKKVSFPVPVKKVFQIRLKSM